jgi:hypothetical protein
MSIQEDIDYIGRLRDQAVTALSKMLEELAPCTPTVPEAKDQVELIRMLVREAHAIFLAAEKSRDQKIIEVTKELLLMDITLAHKAMAMFKRIDILHAQAITPKNRGNLN